MTSIELIPALGITTQEAKRYIRGLAYQGRLKQDGVAFIALYGKSQRTAQRLEEAVKVLGGAVWNYSEFYVSRSRYDNERVYCEVTFDVGNDDDWLVNTIRGDIA